jgi:hypothetical protein
MLEWPKTNPHTSSKALGNAHKMAKDWFFSYLKIKDYACFQPFKKILHGFKLKRDFFLGLLQ